MIPEKNSFLTSFTQRFENGAAHLDMLNSDENWRMFVANEESGPCYTYDPPYDSDPGHTNNIYMNFDFTQWDENLEIFLHERNNFFYSKRNIIGAKRITSHMLEETRIKHPRALGNII